MNPFLEAVRAVLASERDAESALAAGDRRSAEKAIVSSGSNNSSESTLKGLSPRSELADVAKRPFAVARVARELLKTLDERGSGRVGIQRLHEVVVPVLTRVAPLAGGKGRGAKEELYLALIAHDRTGSHSLDYNALATFLMEFIAEWCGESMTSSDVARVSPDAPYRRPASPCPCRPAPRAPPSSPAEALQLTLRTLGGNTFIVTVCGDATLEDLQLARMRAPENNPAFQFLYATNGRILRSGESLGEQGVQSGAFIDLVRVTPAPAYVRLEYHGYSCGPSIRGSCGTFRRAPCSRQKLGRPIYVRDRELSGWNAAMKYHGHGERYLVYEDHALQGARWALMDDQDWPSYDDRSYAFIAGDVPHPGYLEGRKWRIFRDAKYQVSREWLEHDSLQLVVREETEEEHAEV